MPDPELAQGPLELTYPLRTAARLTGLSPELLRAWERRYGVIEPLRTPGGSRRYRASDLERLSLLKSAVEAGHRIGRLAGLTNERLAQLGTPPKPASRDRLADIFEALDALDAAEAQRLLAIQLSTLGATRFAREIAMPLLHEIGERWRAGRLGIAAEHLATAALRSLLGSALQPSAAALRGARIVFATMAGERHEIGLLMAALAAMDAGANPIYLGPDVPVDDLLHAVERSRAAALAMSFVTAPPEHSMRSLVALRERLPAEVHIWLGGVGTDAIATPPGVQRIDSLDQLEQRVGLLDFEQRRR